MRNPTKKIPNITNKVIAKIDMYIINIIMATKVTKIRIETRKSFQKNNESNQKKSQVWVVLPKNDQFKIRKST